MAKFTLGLTLLLALILAVYGSSHIESLNADNFPLVFGSTHIWIIQFCAPDGSHFTRNDILTMLQYLSAKR